MSGQNLLNECSSKCIAVFFLLSQSSAQPTTLISSHHTSLECIALIMTNYTVQHSVRTYYLSLQTSESASMTLNSLHIDQKHSGQGLWAYISQYQQSLNWSPSQMFNIRQQFMTLMQTAAMTTNAVTDNFNEYYSISMITINYSSSHLTHVNIIKQEPLFQSSFTDKNMISDFISFHQQSHLSYSILINQTSILKVNSVQNYIVNHYL